MFSDSAEDLRRLDLKILQNSPIAVYRELDVLETDMRWLANHNYRCARYDVTQWRVRHDILSSLAAAFQDERTPSNLDALEDVACEAVLPLDGGVAIALLSYDERRPALSSDILTALDLLVRAARYQLLFGGRIVVLVHSRNALEKLGPFGGQYAALSPTERAAGLVPHDGD